MLVHLALEEFEERLCQEILVSSLTLVACGGGPFHCSSSLAPEAGLEPVMLLTVMSGASHNLFGKL